MSMARSVKQIWGPKCVEVYHGVNIYPSSAWTSQFFFDQGENWPTVMYCLDSKLNVLWIMEQRANTCILVESLNSKMAANMAAKELKYVYLNL